MRGPDSTKWRATEDTPTGKFWIPTPMFTHSCVHPSPVCPQSCRCMYIHTYTTYTCPKENVSIGKGYDCTLGSVSSKSP